MTKDECIVQGNKAVRALNEDRPAEAEVLLRGVLPHAHKSALVRFTLGLALLKQGKLGEGWPFYDARFDLQHVGALPKWAPVWRGEPLAGKTLVVTWEQGYGDMWQFSRYARTIKARTPTMKMCVIARRGMRSLLESMKCWDVVMEDGDNVGPQGFPVDFISPVMDLARGAGLMRRKDIDGTPYIPKPPAVNLGGEFNVGLCWQGNSEHKKDHWRSLPWSVASLLLDNAPGARWWAIGQSDPRGLNNAPMTSDWMDTARFMAGLDLLITVDTGTAHLAGAMGVKVWNLVHFGADWRWFLDDRRTKWYNSMRIYRQGADRDWEPVIHRVSEDLKRNVFASMNGRTKGDHIRMAGVAHRR